MFDIAAVQSAPGGFKMDVHFVWVAPIESCEDANFVAPRIGLVGFKEVKE